MKTNYKKYVPHTLGAVLLLGVLGWLAWLTVKGTSNEGMTTTDYDFVNAMELFVRATAPLSEQSKSRMNDANKNPYQQKDCFVSLIRNANSDLQELPRIIRSGDMKAYGQNMIIVGYNKCGMMA